MNRSFGIVSAAGGMAVAGWAGVSAASPARQTPVVEAVSRALPGVVNISTEKTVNVLRGSPSEQMRGDLFEQIFRALGEMRGGPMGGIDKSQSLGSGMIVDPSGYILTNYHVVERASTIRVTLADNSVYTARLIAGDEVNDLALIRIEAKKPLSAIRMADDGDLLLGETVIALGNPLGLGHSVTVGVLSAKNREARYGDQVLFHDILQTDAAVNPGNSGGPLLNVDGEVIGVNVAVQENAQNIGFALPINRARALLVQWLAPRTLNRILLGFDLEEREGAIYVTRIDPNGPAQACGMKPGDRLLGANGVGAENLFDFVRALLGARAGDSVSFGYARGETTGVARVTLSAVPAPDPKQMAREKLGLVLGDKPEGRFRKGLPIREILTNGPCASLPEGRFLSQINGINLQSPEDVALALEKVNPGDPVGLLTFSVESAGPGVPPGVLIRYFRHTVRAP